MLWPIFYPTHCGLLPQAAPVTVSAVKNHKKITFSVEDTGEGISPEHIKHLFEQFYRVPGQQVKSGVGLGLSIVKEIIDAHGGKTGVESTYGKGSIFYFTLPLQKETT